LDSPSPGERSKQLPADQITAENKKQIDADPAPAMDPARHWEAHDAGVKNNDHDNRDGAQEIEAGLTFAVLKTWIDGRK
jgi:hypothetical protein